MSALDRESLRHMIREVLAEELGRVKRQSGAFAETVPTPQVREEAVTIGSNAELMAFAHRMLEIGKDGRSRREVESGRWVFRLAGGSAPGQSTPVRATSSSGGTARFDRGLVSERQIDAIGASSERLILGKRARLTPLARDRIRQRGMTIERID